jgi:hypothetical protein
MLISSTSRVLLGMALCAGSGDVLAQYPGWQQRADYKMDIVLDTTVHQVSGVTRMTYWNESPDTLKQLFFHLYFNAFQPGSMMDVRSRNIVDPDPRVGDRISLLPESEQGWCRVQTMRMNGSELALIHDETILQVPLKKFILPGQKVELEWEWRAQVPRQIRRSGWRNAEGIEYSMTQWYPKICAYDHMGWHSNPYVGREFHSEFGNYDVKLRVPAGWPVGATGVLQASADTAKGIWHWKAQQVIDFAWATDPDYVHSTRKVGDITLHFYHQSHADYDANWEALPEHTERAIKFLSDWVGPYPYSTYHVLQGGDGGMEYPMATLITGHRNLRSLVGVTVHELAHSWFQALLATNESLYPYLDEGFTSYVTALCMAHLFANNSSIAPHQAAYSGYVQCVKNGLEEPLTTHADHYQTNEAYGVASYSKGELMLAQLAAVIGKENRDAGLKRYFRDWSFKHPGPYDFMRVMEHTSGLELDWYFQYWIHTTQTIDYAVMAVKEGPQSVDVSLSRIGGMPMPQDVWVTFEDGSTQQFHIPLVMMRGHRPMAPGEVLLPDWPWTHPTYTFSIPTTEPGRGPVVSVELDPLKLSMDVDRGNNRLAFEIGTLRSIQRQIP